LSFHHQNTNKEILNEIWEISVPPLTATQLPCFAQFIGISHEIFSLVQRDMITLYDEQIEVENAFHLLN